MIIQFIQKDNAAMLLVRQKFYIIFSISTYLFAASCSELNDPAPTYSYSIPDDSEADLEVSSLESEGIKDSLIIQMTNSIIKEDIKLIDGVLILRNNKLVYENYFHGYDKDVLHNFYSSAKSITSLLTGIAVDRGFIDDINKPIVDFLPEYNGFLNPDSRKSEITVAHLLNMSSGLECDDWYQNTETAMRNTSDWVKFTLDLPVVSDPGTVGLYCTGGVVTLGRIIENQTGLSLEEFADQFLFSPLHISKVQWEIMPDGNVSGGGVIFLRPRDLLKIGLMVLNGGSWEGDQIVSTDWTDRCAENQITLPGPFDGYGNLWWKQTFQEDVFTFFSSGNGGQNMFIVPAKKMVVVFTSGNQNTELGSQVYSMMSNYILPATK